MPTTYKATIPRAAFRYGTFDGVATKHLMGRPLADASEVHEGPILQDTWSCDFVIEPWWHSRCLRSFQEKGNGL